MQNQVQFIKTDNLILQNTDSSPLKNGENVFVRVLSSDGGGKYTVSFAGNRVHVKSELSLAPGESFSARLNVLSDGTVRLVQLEKMPSESLNVQNQSVLASSLAAFGVPSDELSVRLIQFFEQSGMRIDRTIMDKARKIALQFPGKEKIAGEAAALLLENGMEPTVEAVEALIAFALGEDCGSQNGSRGSEDKKSESDARETENLLSKIYGKPLKNAPGLLTLINQVAKNDHHWIFLPFEWQDEFSGIIRLLLNLRTKFTEKIEIICKNPLKSYSFVLYCKESKIKEIRFCTLPPLLSSEIPIKEKRLGDLLNSGMNQNESVPVTYSACALLGGLCTMEQEPQAFEKSV